MISKGWTYCCLTLLLCSAYCHASIDSVSVRSLLDIQVFIESLRLDSAQHEDYLRSLYNDKVANAEAYLDMPLKMMKGYELGNLRNDSTWQTGERENSIISRATLYEQIVQLWQYGDSVLYHRYNEQLVQTAIHQWDSIPIDTLLTEEQKTSIKKQLTALNSYKDETERFARLFELDGRAKDKFTMLENMEDLSSSLLIAYTKGILFPYINQNGFDNYENTDIHHLKLLHDKMLDYLNSIIQGNDATINRLKQFFEFKNEL